MAGISICKVETNETIYNNYNNCEALSNLNGIFSRDNVYAKTLQLLNDYLNRHAFNCLFN